MARAGVKAMLHDRVQLIATTCGVVFAVILSTQQLGILYGLFHKNTMLIDHGNADIWMMPRAPAARERRRSHRPRAGAARRPGRQRR